MKQLFRWKKTATGNNTVLWYLIVLLAAGSLYTLTCAPGVLWQDSGLFVYRILHNDLEGNLGIALAHPLYIMIGIVIKSIPIGDLAWRINLISAVSSAIAVGNLFLLLRLLLNKYLPAIIGAMSLALSWTFWQHSVLAEVYTLYAAQLLTELIVLLLYIRTKKISLLYLLVFLNGLALANHLFATLALACYLAFIVILLYRHQLKWINVGVMAFLWILGASPYEYLIIKNLIVTGDLSGTLVSALFGEIWHGSVANTSLSAKIFFENIIFIILNFPTPNLLLAFTGLWVICRKIPEKSFAYILLAMTIIYFIFAFRYTVPDRYAFFLPFYCFLAILIGLGANKILNRYNKKSFVILILILSLLPIPAYFLTPSIGKKFYKSLGQRRQRPYRDEYTYFLQPWKNNCTGAQRFAEEALMGVEENSIIYGYTTDVHALLYVQQYYKIRPDVMIVSDFDSGKNAPEFNETTIEQLMEEHPVYVNSPLRGYCPKFLLDNYEFQKTGVLWRVVKKNSANP